MKHKAIAAAVASFIVVLAGSLMLSLARSTQAGNGRESAVRTATAPSLGTAGSFAVLAGSTVTNVPTSTIIGDVGLSPATGAGIGVTCLEVTGTIYSVDAAGPLPCRVTNPSLLTTAKSDLTIAYNNLAGQACDATISADLGGMTLNPGVYCSASSMGLTGILTLDALGDPNAVWVFQMGTTLITASNSSVDIINGGQACNVFWQVGSAATLGTNSDFKGTIIADQAITLNTGANLEGRALASIAAVTLESNTVTVAVCAATPTPTPGGPTATPTPGGPTATPTPTPTCVDAVLSLSAEVISPGQELRFSGCIPAFGDRAVDVYLVLVSPSGALFSAISPDGIAPGLHPYARGIINPAVCQCRDLLTHVVCADAERGVWTAILAVLPAGAAPKASNAIAMVTVTAVVE